MFSRILIPVDGSHFSEEVIAYALGMAKATQVPLVFLRSVTSDADRDIASHYLAGLTSKYGGEGKLIVDNTDLAAAIIAEAREQADTLIMMTSHGHTGLMEAVMGNTAMRIVRGSSTPVMLFRPQGKHQGDIEPIEVTKVLLPLDGSPQSETMAPYAAELAKWLGAQVYIVQVLKLGAAAKAGAPSGDLLESNYVRAKAKEFKEVHGLKVNWEVLHGDPIEAISGQVKDRPHTIIAMATHGHNPLKAAIMGSVTSGCLHRTGVPLLTRIP